jgi:hypothetical protein
MVLRHFSQQLDPIEARHELVHDDYHAPFIVPMQDSKSSFSVSGFYHLIAGILEHLTKSFA